MMTRHFDKPTWAAHLGIKFPGRKLLSGVSRERWNPQRVITTMIVLSLTSGCASRIPPTDHEWQRDPTDERGAANLISAETVVRAAQLVRRGRVFQLGRVYESGMPVFGERSFDLTMPQIPAGGPLGTNHLTYFEEELHAHIGQVGTQFDGLGHVALRVEDDDVFYNGFVGSEILATTGLRRLGVENAGVFFTRGVLLDVARHKQTDRLPSGYIITVDDLVQTMTSQGVQLEYADSVLIRTGHGRLWATDADEYGRGEPGPGITALRWLADKNIVLIGADTWGVEAVPGENADHVFDGHDLLLRQRGIYIVENLDLEELSAQRVFEFACVIVPLPIRGATGSPVCPIAID